MATLLALLALGPAWMLATYAMFVFVEGSIAIEVWLRSKGLVVLPLLWAVPLIAPVLAALAVGFVLDVGFNYTFGRLMLGNEFRQGEATLSSRLKRIRLERTEKPWRLAVADFICKRMLNPFAPCHC